MGQVHEADGHAVGLGCGDLGPADGAGAAVNVLDNDGLANILLSVLSKDTGGNVGAVAGLVGYDHGDRAVGSPAFGCGSLSSGSLGGRCLGCGGLSGLGAAGAQSQNHAQSQNQCKILFHFTSSCKNIVLSNLSHYISLTNLCQ